MEPVTTDDFFACSGDDRVLYWQEDGDVELSPAMQQWLTNLQREHQALAEMEVPESDVEKRLCRVLDELHEKYWLYGMRGPIDAMTGNKSDRRLWALWRMFEQRVAAPTWLTAVESRQAFEINYPNGLPVFLWRALSPQRKDWHYAKKLLLRFLGLMANTSLRNKLFGI